MASPDFLQGPADPPSPLSFLDVTNREPLMAKSAQSDSMQTEQLPVTSEMWVFQSSDLSDLFSSFLANIAFTVSHHTWDADAIARSFKLQPTYL